MKIENHDICQKIKESQYDIRIAAFIKSRYDTMSIVDLKTGMCEQIYLKDDNKLNHKIQRNYNLFIQRAINELVFEDDLAIFQDYLLLDNMCRRAEEDDDSAEIIFEYRMKTPEIIWLQVQILFVHQDNNVIAYILSQDITDQKQKEAEEKQEKQDWSYIINSMGSMFFASYYIDLTTDTFRIIKQTSKAGNILSITQNYNEAISTYSQRSVHPDYRLEYIETLGLSNLLKSLTPDQSYIAIEYQKIRKRCNKNTKNSWIRATVILVETKNGIPTKALYVEQDVTESKKKEKKEVEILKEACEAANQANDSKSEFLSRMSHDIRTPLNAIIGMTTIASSHLEDRDRVSDCLDKIAISSKNLLSLMNEVLDMNKIESGKLKLSEENFSLTDFIENILSEIRPTLEAKQHTLDFHISNVVHDEVIGDISRLQQVFMNILGNAINYTPNGGKLKLKVSERPSTLHDHSCYEFIFEDNGIGMSEEFIPHIFDPFIRAEDTRTNKIKGSGLGMTITQNIIQMMNGTIDIESKLQEGSKFTVTIFLKHQNITIPVIKEEKKEIPDKTETFSKELFEGKRVLLVDDIEINREIAVEIIETTGVAVDTATNGKEALEQFENMEEGYYNLIFMDIQMPIMNGYEATKAIRNSKKADAKQIPIIAVTANAYVEDMIASKRAGMNEHIAKPIDVEQLLECLTRWLNNSKELPKN